METVHENGNAQDYGNESLEDHMVTQATANTSMNEQKRQLMSM